MVLFNSHLSMGAMRIVACTGLFESDLIAHRLHKRMLRPDVDLLGRLHRVGRFRSSAEGG